MNGKSIKGLTLIEILVVVFVMAILALALFPLIETTYNSWRLADRRVESLMVGRTGMDKLSREIRKAFDLAEASDPLYIDFYPDWASGTKYRFDYDNVSDFRLIQLGTATDSLAAPIDSFEYVTYTRRLDEDVTEHRRVNAFKFRYDVSDSRSILPDTSGTASNLNPMTFRTQAQMRVSREGYMYALTSAFASHTYAYHDNPGEDICVRAHCDRVDPDDMAQASASFKWRFGGATVWVDLTHVADGDYWVTNPCPNINAAGIHSGFGGAGSMDTAYFILQDNNGETCEAYDMLQVFTN
ncbi:MAG TPA: type II secretion system protein [bacterium]|nr:type II secretion system protein [bacterium]